MTRTYTKQELTERYEKLPDALKDAIFSTEVAEKIFETGKKHGLTIEKIGFLAEETGRVILGLTRPNEFVAILAERLGIAPGAAQKIASDINHQIFFPLREILKSTHQVNVGEFAIQKPAAVDLRPLARPATAVPPSARPIPQGTAKVPPIDLRRPEQAARQPLVDIGDIAMSAPRPAHSLTREEAEKVVAEKKTIAQPPPLPAPPKPPKPIPAESLGVSVSNLETDTPSGGRAEKPKLSTANPQVFPQSPKPFSTTIPASSPQPHDYYRGETSIVKPAPQPKIPPIDLRKDKEKDKEIALDFMPPPPAAPRQATPAPAAPPLQPAPTTIATSMPVAKQETPPPPQVPHTPPAQSKIPPIDLRAQPAKPPTPINIKTRPWSGTDPYKEPIE